jgi:hypothetical protein
MQLDWRVRIGIVAAAAMIIVTAMIVSIWVPSVLDALGDWIRVGIGFGVAGGIGIGVGVAGGPSPSKPNSGAPANRSPRSPRHYAGGRLALLSLIVALALVSFPGCGAPCQWAGAIVDAADAGATELAEEAPDDSVARAAGIVGSVADLGRILVAFCEGTLSVIDEPADAAARTLPTAQEVVCPVGE